MKIETQEGDILAVTGLVELVAANASQVRDDIRAALTSTHAALELDLSQVTFLDSSGLGALISLQKALRSQNGTVRLINPAANVRQILELTRLHRVFEITQR